MLKKFLKETVAFILAGSIALGAAMSPAYAIYNDQTRNFPARADGSQSVQYYRITINYNDTNIGTAQKFGALPADAYILQMDAFVTTAFNAGTTNVITLGVSTAANELSASGTLAPATLGIQHLTAAAGLGTAVTSSATYTGKPVTLYAKYTQTGTAATAGAVTIVIAYVPNNDQ